MKTRPMAAALLAATLLAGCAAPYSEAPIATNFPTTQQQKLQAAAHWNMIAGDVARQITRQLPDKRPLHVSHASAKSQFDRAFLNQLTSALVAEGNTVFRKPGEALTVEVDTQTVRFAANRPQYSHVGVATALAAGLWVLHDAHATAGAVLIAALAGKDAYDWFRSEFATGETPQTEIIVTISVSDADKYLARQSNIYYVADADSRMYEPPRRVPTKNMEVVGQ